MHSRHEEEVEVLLGRILARLVSIDCKLGQVEEDVDELILEPRSATLVLTAN